ncbi:hypothetical protein ASD83_04960 [Devosia sp. Root685]|nr:hypothetical protein ASD83_04960 [Devosia sp. Root685]
MRLGAKIALALSIAALLTVGVAACRRAEAVLRYRLTLTIDIGGVRQSASAVQEIRAQWTEPLFYFPGQTSFKLRQRGQAVELPLSDGGRLFLSMQGKGGSSARYLLTACGLLDPPTDGRALVARIGAFRGNCDIPSNRMPVIFTVNSEQLPITGYGIDPSAGEGLGATTVTIELSTTNDPILFDLDQRFAWLNGAGSSSFPLVIVSFPDKKTVHLGATDLIKQTF